ncbi:DUF3413 domain-containing protein [Vibrio parahaemolyticus]|uniref:DUF3413 domain-containing protein n=2 Tax=Vibrio parahaemolyticus TaxID=670 RepID=UPI002360EC4E|nr:DUF3413 domain-containing protein [Vibrio parahaemolyticus]HCG5066509.1 DUF3413 domain-containing protein [Vibrio parahaemolyticus]HCG8056004.1 DUF3413 domain-containing protein [Vibrio parahaemolyticus]
MNTLSFKSKLHVHGWLIAINAVLAMVIATRYFAFLPELPSDALGLVFISAGTFSQMTLLALVIGLLSLPLLLLPTTPRRLLQSGIAAFGLVVLAIDTIVFAQYRFHINAVVLDLVLSGQIVSFPLITWVMVVSAIFSLWSMQWLVVRWLEHKPAICCKKWGRKFALVTFAALIITNVSHIWAVAHAYQPVTMVKRYLPLFYPATANSFMRKQGWIDEAALEQQKALNVKVKNDINYPLTALKTQAVIKPVNIMLLVVDSWRYDTFNADNTPNLWRYAQRGMVLPNHISTGNATRTGIFGLFYGMPGTYWHAMLANGQSPVLMDRLQELDYQLGIFTAAHLRKPEFSDTVFVNVPDLRMGSKGSGPAELDADLTQDWLQWYAQRDVNKPTFSFLFYDSPHGYDFPDDFSPKYEPMLEAVNYLKLNNDTDPTEFFNRYKTSVRYVDSMAGKVLDTLEKNGDLERTLVIITGDHGQEMNDNRLNFWGHNSNFTNAQVRVPFAIFGPGIDNKAMYWKANQFSSHEDVAPTIMQQYLGVDNVTSDYALGVNLLLSPPDRPWLLSSNYSGYALITHDSIVEIGGGGQYQLLDKTNRPLTEQQPNFVYLQEALKRISWFSQ